MTDEHWKDHTKIFTVDERIIELWEALDKTRKYLENIKKGTAWGLAVLGIVIMVTHWFFTGSDTTTATARQHASH